MDIKIKTALISVSDKSGLDQVIKKLHQEKIKLISTGGTAQFIKDMNIPVTDVSDVTNFPEMMDGRIKTLMSTQEEEDNGTSYNEFSFTVC